ncbi:MAG: hypothetical protein ACKV2Q_15260 [Planctomycetaceae bacterium]
MTNELPPRTITFEKAAEFVPQPSSVYVHGKSVEERSGHVSGWLESVRDTVVVEVVREDRDKIVLQCPRRGQLTISLRSASQLSQFWTSLPVEAVYLDITGLRHGTWAGLLRGLENAQCRMYAVYVEPIDYQMSPLPTENEIFDLSEKIEGVAPLPGFARLRREQQAGCFVPLLGFEGTRLLYLINQLEPPEQKIIPIVGVPGYRCEYPFVAYLANQKALRDSQAWRRVRFAAAECPFDVMNVLAGIHRENSREILTVAPIGTKPQALGAVLFAIRNPDKIELVYDHPVRKAKRTRGTSRLHLYQIGCVLGRQ